MVMCIHHSAWIRLYPLLLSYCKLRLKQSYMLVLLCHFVTTCNHILHLHFILSLKQTIVTRCVSHVTTSFFPLH